MKVYLVTDSLNSPGYIYAVMANEEDAAWFAQQIEDELETRCMILERNVYYGQPSDIGYNK